MQQPGIRKANLKARIWPCGGLTPSGINFPHSSTPPCGTRRGNIATAAPAQRMPSFTQARSRGIFSKELISVGNPRFARSLYNFPWYTRFLERAKRMCDKDAEVVSVPGPRFSFASDNAVCVGTPAEIMTLIRFGKGDFLSRSLFPTHAFKVHYSGRELLTY